MNKKFIITGLITTLINLFLNTAIYFLILKDFYHSYAALSEECMKQLHRPPEQIIVWAMVVTSFSMGYIITMVIKWSGAKTLTSGLKYGLIFSLLFWGSVNFGLYASSNFFSLESVFVDYACSVTAMTISCSVSAVLLGLKNFVSGKLPEKNFNN